jgi:hypothetical protein
MKKIIIATILATLSFTSFAKTSAKDCQDYGDIVGLMQDIRNKGGSIGLAFNDLKNLTQSKDPQSLEYGRSLTEIAQYIWSKPQGNMTQGRAAEVGTALCNRKYRS